MKKETLILGLLGVVCRLLMILLGATAQSGTNFLIGRLILVASVTGLIFGNLFGREF